MFTFSSSAIPFTRQSFADWNLPHKKAANKTALETIYAQYKTAIDFASKVTNVPKEIITSIIFIESGGDPDASSGGTYGCMQILPDAMTDVLALENKKKNLTKVEQDALRLTMGRRLDDLLKMKGPGDAPIINGKYTPPFITKANLLNPSFNILCGSIFLALLIGQETKPGKTDLGRVVIRYNLGMYKKLPPTNSTDELLALPGAAVSMNEDRWKVSKDYALKFVGKDGTLDLFV